MELKQRNKQKMSPNTKADIFDNFLNWKLLTQKWEYVDLKIEKF